MNKPQYLDLNSGTSGGGTFSVEHSGISLSAKHGNKPDGLLVNHTGVEQTVLIEKQGSELRLKLISTESPEWQSRIDLDNPDKLLSPYMSAMFLFLLWTDFPVRVHIIGLGGGCVPIYLHNHFPEATTDCTEIDSDVYSIAKSYFGLDEDERLRVYIQDGREFLDNYTQAVPYDVIIVDAFRGVGFSPLRLGTIEFYRLCKAKIRDGGIVVVNLLPKDPLFSQKVRTLKAAFRNVYFYFDMGATVFFASDADMSDVAELTEKAVELDIRFRLHFSLAEMIRMLRPLSGLIAFDKASDPNGEQILIDSMESRDIPISQTLLQAIGRNDLCPCGSGRKMKKCHGK